VRGTKVVAVIQIKEAGGRRGLVINGSKTKY
jgi:hypothetical protein